LSAVHIINRLAGNPITLPQSWLVACAALCHHLAFCSKQRRARRRHEPCGVAVIMRRQTVGFKALIGTIDISAIAVIDVAVGGHAAAWAKVFQA